MDRKEAVRFAKIGAVVTITIIGIAVCRVMKKYG